MCDIYRIRVYIHCSIVRIVNCMYSTLCMYIMMQHILSVHDAT